jgi:hypothetical protein
VTPGPCCRRASSSRSAARVGQARPALVEYELRAERGPPVEQLPSGPAQAGDARGQTDSEGNSNRPASCGVWSARCRNRVCRGGTQVVTAALVVWAAANLTSRCGRWHLSSPASAACPPTARTGGGRPWARERILNGRSPLPVPASSRLVRNSAP